eukprot:Rhum_TRINITY_DN15245_c8_g1::Rhum_TRINITY_DN15245_c8_g1_i1::g.146897::m.146897
MGAARGVRRKSPRRGSAAAGKTQREKLVLNKQELNSIKQIAYEYPDVEFLYLRENDFDSFDPYIRLVDLKMLDLSLNNISSVAFLWGGALPAPGTVGELSLPRLRHLYLTGNCIDSLQGVSFLNSLETLALSNNCIRSFEGLGSLPNLRVLSLQFNEIASFKHFPFLLSLAQLSLHGNPLAESATYRAMAASVCCAYLQKIDNQPVTDAEMETADRMQGKVAFCITEGLVPSSLDDDVLKLEADEFLLQLQRQQSAGKPLRLQSISLGRTEDSPYKGTTPIEGVPVLLQACLQDMRPPQRSRTDVFHSTCLFPVAFKVTGDASEVLVTGSMNAWQEPIPLARVVNGDEVSYQTYLYLPPGEHEYRYLVDGVEKVSEDRKTVSKYGKGACNYYPVSDVEVPEDQEDRDTILHVRWLRSNDFNGFDLLPDQNSLVYTPTEEDVGRCMRCEVLAYEEGGFSSIVFDITQPVQPGFPTCAALDIVGDAVEGEPLSVEYVYTGGEEHHQLNLRWFRVTPDEHETDVTEYAEPGGLVYTPSPEDVGCKIKVDYAPMRSDWTAGNPVTAVTATVRGLQ